MSESRSTEHHVLKILSAQDIQQYMHIYVCSVCIVHHITYVIVSFHFFQKPNYTTLFLSSVASLIEQQLVETKDSTVKVKIVNHDYNVMNLDLVLKCKVGRFNE